ncbi:MAG TPA: hypothetical protein VJ948_10750 [Acidimicrobiia bacterium]|nr:hypothetical protein [Acidimicrobiia bacterium]
MIDQQSLFVERLSEHDLRVLAGLSGAPGTVPALREQLADRPESIEPYLAHPDLYHVLFADQDPGMIPGLSPLLAFSSLVYQARRDLGSASYVPEWVGAGERLPVFDVESLRLFIDDTTRRYLIIELLNSFTRVASGTMWVRTPRGYRRRRFSELDPVHLAEMVESLPTAQRAGGYRRLGDVALFLTGVFPDHTARHPVSALGRARLARSIGVSNDEGFGAEYLRFLEQLGSAWYGRAANTPFLPTSFRESLEEMATGFTPARRFLNYVADRYLHRLDTGLMNPVS